MNFASVSEFAGFLCLCFTNCSVALATAFGLGAIFKAPHVELALQGSLYSAYALCFFGVLNILALIASAMRSRLRRFGEGS